MKGYKTLKYTADDKMSDLICANYHIILVLSRFRISMGFKEMTIEEVCQANNINMPTLLAIVNLLINDNKTAIDISTLSLQSLVEYLNNSHRYFMEYKLPSIRQKLIEAIPNDEVISKVVIDYYDKYVDEVEKHMRYEEDMVFKYVGNLLEREADSKFDINIFSEHHDSVDSKLTELKNILIKYYPTEATNELGSVLFDIFSCESDLASHCQIEDHLLIPAIRHIEKRGER